MKTLIVLTLLVAATLQAQTPLPPNYKTTFENPDFLVMHVHYAAHEVVPMHDHTAYPTLYLYLNDSGEVQLIHEHPAGFTITRPPTHTGAFRIAPGVAERHSIKSLSDTDSDFLRIELKRIPPAEIKTVFRGDVPATLTPGVRTEYEDPALRVQRIICPGACIAAPLPARSLLIAINNAAIDNKKLNPGDVFFLPANEKTTHVLSPNGQFLRVQLLYPE